MSGNQFVSFLFSLLIWSFCGQINSRNRGLEREETELSVLELEEFEEFTSTLRQLGERYYVGEILTLVNKRRIRNEVAPLVFKKRSQLHNCAAGYFSYDLDSVCHPEVRLIVEEDFPPHNVPLREWVKKSTLAQFLHLRPLREIGLSLQDDTLVVSFAAPSSKKQLNQPLYEVHSREEEDEEEDEEDEEDKEDNDDGDEDDDFDPYLKGLVKAYLKRKSTLQSRLEDRGLLEKLADQLRADWTTYSRGLDTSNKRTKQASSHSVTYTETAQTVHEKASTNGFSNPHIEKETTEKIHQTSDLTTNTQETKHGKITNTNDVVKIDKQTDKQTKLDENGQTTEDTTYTTNQQETVTADQTDADSGSNKKKSTDDEQADDAPAITVTANKRSRSKRAEEGGGLSVKMIVIITLSCALGVLVMIVAAALVIRGTKKARRKKHMRMLYGAPANLEAMSREGDIQQAPEVADTRMGNPIFDTNTPTDYKKL